MNLEALSGCGSSPGKVENAIETVGRSSEETEWECCSAQTPSEASKHGVSELA